MKNWRSSSATQHQRSSTTPRGRRLTKLKLVLEPLEARRLLAGIHVSVYVDNDSSRGFEPTADAPAPNRLVYVDLNKNGGFDSGEPISTTNADGVAFFDQLAAGDYAIGLLTNSMSQLQSEPSSIASAGVQRSSSPAERLLVSSDLNDVWSVDSAGMISRLGGAASSSSIQLGGNVVASAVTSERTAWIIFNSEQGARVGRFDLRTGDLSISSLGGRLAQEAVLDLQNANGSLIALLSTPQGNRFTRVDQLASGLRLQPDRIPTAAVEMIAGASTSTLVAIGGSAGSKRVALLDVDQSFTEFASLPASEDVTEVSLAANGDLLLIARSTGVHAFSLADRSVRPIAVLAEAAAPLANQATDGRIVTSNRSDSKELIVWDTSSWQPVGRSEIPEPAEQLVSSRRGNVVYGYGRSGITSVDLTVTAMEVVSLPTETSVAEVRLGVQLLQENTVPVAQEDASRTATEDLEDRFSPEVLGVVDPDGDDLWFSVSVQPRHGAVAITEDGSWIYTPLPNFNGVDFATIRAHDGQSSIEFRLEWIVQPINDPPLSMSVDTQLLPENSPIGTQVGSVSILDVDGYADYRITTSDPRFSVENGYIYLTSGHVDYETETSIAIEVFAVDITNQDYRIHAQATIQVGDVNEPPTAIRVTEATVPENELGATVAHVELIDPDAEQDYVFSVSDPRFEVVGKTLKLRDDQQVDFEREPVIELRVTAVDASQERFSISTGVEVTVLDRNDPPTAILLAGRSVERFVLGSVVGEVTVLDPDNDQYIVSVSDPRFEVVERTLKLRDDVQLEDQAQTELTLTLTAVARNGDRISDSFAIAVSTSRSPGQNRRLPEDVNNDGIVSALDVLLIVNLLNTHGSHRLPVNPGNGTGEPTGIWPDVDGDGLVTPLDVLRVINYINNRRSGGGEGEGAPAVGLKQATRSLNQVPHNHADNEWERQKRANSEIDAELELLLDQLSIERRDG